MSNDTASKFTPDTATRFEVVVVAQDGQGGVGYQQTKQHCINVAVWISEHMPGVRALCSFLTENGHTWRYFDSYKDGVKEEV